MQRRFQRTAEIYAIYRLLVPPPVTVAWRTIEQTLWVRENPFPPHGVIELSGAGGRGEHFEAADQARHVLANGYKVAVPSTLDTFFRRLVADGRAAVVCGPHSEIYWLTEAGMPPALIHDARYTWRSGQTLGRSGLGSQAAS